jgi:hypothetical protein
MNRYLVKVGSLVVEKVWIGVGSAMLTADETKAEIYPTLAAAEQTFQWLTNQGLTPAIWRVTLTIEESLDARSLEGEPANV